MSISGPSNLPKQSVTPSQDPANIQQPDAKKAEPKPDLTSSVAVGNAGASPASTGAGAALPAPHSTSELSLQGLLMLMQSELEKLGFESMEKEAASNLDKVEQKLKTYEDFHKRRLATADRLMRADQSISTFADKIGSEYNSEAKILRDFQFEKKSASREVFRLEQLVKTENNNLNEIPGGEKFDALRLEYTQKLEKATEDLNTARGVLSAAESKVNDQQTIAGDLAHKNSALNDPSTPNDLYISQLRLTAMAAQKNNITGNTLNDLLAQVTENSIPTGGLMGDAGEALARARPGFGQVLTGREIANLLDVGSKGHPIEIAFDRLMEDFEFQSNLEVREKINEALFKTGDDENEKEAIKDLEEQISIVLDLMMSRWAGDEVVGEELEQQYLRKISI